MHDSEKLTRYDLVGLALLVIGPQEHAQIEKHIIEVCQICEVAVPEPDGPIFHTSQLHELGYIRFGSEGWSITEAGESRFKAEIVA